MQARAIEEIAQALVVYAREYSSPLQRDGSLNNSGLRYREAETEFRRLAALLGATAQTLRAYSAWQSMRLVLPQDDILEASKELIGLANSCPPGPDKEDRLNVINMENRIKQLLRIA
ncbi:MAG: hypothetical protein HW399_73 [Dehalococcoidia bacterium]|nr:hypothetical protein [Dehalococcoidia bacterium]